MTAWMVDAECAGDLDFFDRPHDLRIAACEPCPVRLTCAASDGDEAWGAKDNTARWCLAGHDTWQVKRKGSGECRECYRLRLERTGKPTPTACRKGHSLIAVGTEPDGRCSQCRRDTQRDYDDRRKR